MVLKLSTDVRKLYRKLDLSLANLAFGLASSGTVIYLENGCEFEFWTHEHEFPAIWSRDTGQWISCFNGCQLITAWVSKIKEVQGKPWLYVCQYGGHVARLRHRRRRCRRRPYAPASNTANDDNHEKINS